MGGSSESQGFIEVCAGGEYVLVSQEGFTIAEANVICNELQLGEGDLLGDVLASGLPGLGGKP